MLRNVADSLFRALLRAFPADRPYPPDRYRADPMPASVAHFLDHTLTSRAAREVERLRATRTGWIDYAHPDVRDRFTALDQALRQHAHVPEAEWERGLRHAVHQVTRHAARPLDALVDFVFQDEDDALPVGVLQQRMHFFSAYSYLRDAVDLYVDQKNIDVLRRDRFAALLERVAQQMTADYAPEQWLRLVTPLFALTAAAPDVREDHVPAALLLSFFEQHGHRTAVRRLQDRLAHDEEALLSREALRVLLSGREEPAPTDRRPEPQPEAPQPQRRAQPAPSEASEGPVPLWKQFRSQAPDEQPAPSPAAQAQDADEAVPLWQRFRPRPAQDDRSEDDLVALERDVLDAEGRAQRDRFVRHLFDGSTAAYRSALERLRTASNWNEASRIIGSEVFKKHGVNIYSEEAVAFTDAVEARFQ